jgi:hypothetical protein
MSGFWDALPSWLTELASGCVTVTLALVCVWLCQWWWGLLIVATALSVIYERFIDRNGWDWDDIKDRQYGIILAVYLWVILR